jgi:hypothetical protein
MRVSEIIGKTLDWTGTLNLTAAQEPDVASSNSAEYANAPHEVEQPIATIIAQGDDVNKPKHPSDIRTNAPSMYPDFQAKE